MSARVALFVALCLPLSLWGRAPEPTEPAATSTPASALAQGARVRQGAPAEGRVEDPLKDVNNQIRKELFDTVLPEAMRKNSVDMWIHVMRESIPDPFGAEDLGSTSGVFVFTDRGGDRIERAILERRWGDSHASETWRVDWDTRSVETSGAYDIIQPPILVKQPPGTTETEYDYRFKGFKKFLEERDPKRIAINYKLDFGPYPTTTRATDGLSHTDYVLLAREIGDKYAARLVPSEHVMMDYLIRKVPTEIELLKKLRKEEDEQVKKAFAAIVPGVTKNRDAGVDVFRRRGTGISQRGRTAGHENVVIEGGDVVAAPSQGLYAYVLRRGEREPPPEVKKLWAEHLKVDRILAETIKTGLTPREIVKTYKLKLEKEGFIVRDDQMQLFDPKNNFPAYSAGFDLTKTFVNIDCHGMAKGARRRKFENYFGPRIGSNGPQWMWDIPLPPIHHLVLEYFIYMPWPSSEYEDQYTYFWDHEQVLANEKGVEYSSPPQQALQLIRYR